MEITVKTIFVAVASLVAVSACAGRTYRPAIQEPLSKVVENGCRNNEGVIVTAQVSQVFQNRIVLADNSMSPPITLPIDLPGRGSPKATMQRWFGTSKYELTADKLNQLRAQGTPVTATLECKGPQVAPVARNIEFANPDGTRVAIAY
jgi:hypothetical protein